MENIENLKLYINSLSQSISNYEQSLTPLQNKQLSDMIVNINTTSEEQQIQILNNFAYILISTLFSYLKSLGIDTDSHPIKMELTRIKSSMNRLKNIKNEINGDTNKQQNEEEKKKLLKLKEYLSRTLGIRDVGLSIDVKSKGTSAISNQNFQGKHTKFNDDDEEEEEDKKQLESKQDDLKNNNNNKVLKKSKNKKSTNTSKITKPKSNKKSMTKNSSKKDKNK